MRAELRHAGEFSSPKQGTFYHYNDFWRLDPSTREWTRIEVKGKGPPARSGHRMTYFKVSLERFDIQSALICTKMKLRTTSWFTGVSRTRLSKRDISKIFGFTIAKIMCGIILYCLQQHRSLMLDRPSLFFPTSQELSSTEGTHASKRTLPPVNTRKAVLKAFAQF